jgi:hypothetical protein
VPWVKIDDHFDEHPKMAKVGPLGWGLWLAGLAYCNRNLTDGFIPFTKARMLVSLDIAPDDGKLWTLARVSGMAGDDLDVEWLIALLVDVGIWHETPGGYLVHDYAEYQPTKAQVLAERAKKVAAGRAGGQASAQARAQPPAQANGQPPAQAKSNPVPVPVPVPQKDEDAHASSVESAVSTRTKYPADFELFWRSYPTGHGNKVKAFDQWKRLKPSNDERNAIMAGLDAWKASPRWQRNFVKAADIWLRDRWWEDEPPADDADVRPKSAADWNKGGTGRLVTAG